MCTSREAFDLYNKVCRKHFRKHFKTKWKYFFWWKLVFKDTYNRVCSS